MWGALAVASAVVGILAGAQLIVEQSVRFSRWGGVLWVSALVYIPFVLVPAALAYAALGLLGRATGSQSVNGIPFRFAFSVTLAGLVLPLAIRQNLRRPGVSLSLYHVGPYAAVVVLALALALAVGLLFAWSSARARGDLLRRCMTAAGAGLAVLLALGALQVASGALTDDRPVLPPDAGYEAGPELLNAILITVDTLRAGHLQSYGYSKNTDPEIRRHFRDGLRFADAVCPVPVTRPTHASILTGVHPAVLGMRWNEGALRHDVQTLGELLQARGYETAAFVAAWPLFGERSGLDRGFGLYSDAFSPILEVDRRMDELPAVMLLRKLGLVETLHRDAAAITDAALAWMRKPRQRPFFLWVHYYDPHHPYEPPMEFARLMGASPDGVRDTRGLRTQVMRGQEIAPSDRDQAMALYDGEIRYVDASIGRLLDEVDAQGLRDRTVVLLTADHGETMLERAGAEKLAFTHGRWLKEWDLRVPFLLRGPGIPLGVDERATGESMDVMPTLLVALGAPIPEGVMGRNLLDPLAAGDSRPALSYNSPRDGCITRLSARTREFKLLVEPDQNREYLYHLPSDPGEEHDVAAEFPDIAATLRDAVDALPIVKPLDRGPDPAELDRLRALGYVQ